jgi:hypothetical protein
MRGVQYGLDLIGTPAFDDIDPKQRHVRLPSLVRPDRRRACGVRAAWQIRMMGGSIAQ